MTARIVGLDLSLTSTGICHWNGDTSVVRSKLEGDARLLDLGSAIKEAIHLADYAVLEDLPTHARSAGLTGRVQGVARWHLQGAKVPYVAIPPATLKKFATGRGNADKAAMAAAMEAEGYDVSGELCYLEPLTDDEVDAWWLREAGKYLVGEGRSGSDPSALDRYLGAFK